MIRRPIKVVLRTLNTLVKSPNSFGDWSPEDPGTDVITRGHNSWMTDRKFLQETNFDDDIDFDSESEHRQTKRYSYRR